MSLISTNLMVKIECLTLLLTKKVKAWKVIMIDAHLNSEVVASQVKETLLECQYLAFFYFPFLPLAEYLH